MLSIINRTLLSFLLLLLTFSSPLLAQTSDIDIIETETVVEAPAPVVVPVRALTPAPAESHLVGYNNGFFIQNEDKSFVFKINGKFQPKYRIKRDPKDTPKGSHSFSIRRAAVAFKGTLQEKLAFGFALQHSTNSQDFNSVNIIAAVLSYMPRPEFSIDTGMVGLPLDQAWFGSSSKMLFTDPPLTATQTDQVERKTIARSGFGGPDGLGVSFYGDVGRFYYVANLVNGAEDNYNFNTNKRMSAGAMIGVNIMGDPRGLDSDFSFSESPQLTLSAGLLREPKTIDSSVTPNPATIDYSVQGSTGLIFFYRGFALRTEGYAKTIKVSNAGSAVDLAGKKTDVGYFTSFGYFVVPKKFELAFMGSQIFREGVANDSHQVGLGFNWYLYGQNLKLQADYYLKKAYDRVVGRSFQNSHTFDAQLAAYF